MSILGSIFTWWNGATIGTHLGLRGKTRMGSDALGNVYWQGGKDTAGNPRRWVIYNGPNDASRPNGMAGCTTRWTICQTNRCRRQGAGKRKRSPT